MLRVSAQDCFQLTSDRVARVANAPLELGTLPALVLFELLEVLDPLLRRSNGHLLPVVGLAQNLLRGDLEVSHVLAYLPRDAPALPPARGS